MTTVLSAGKTADDSPCSVAYLTVPVQSPPSCNIERTVLFFDISSATTESAYFLFKNTVSDGTGECPFFARDGMNDAM